MYLVRYSIYAYTTDTDNYMVLPIALENALQGHSMSNEHKNPHP